MVKARFKKFASSALFIFTTLLFFGTQNQSLFALSQAQIDAFNSGVFYFNTEATNSLDCQTAASQASCSGVGDACLGIALPTINDPAGLATAIDTFIKNETQGSSIPSPLYGLGQNFVEGAARWGVNPLLEVAVAGAESSWATDPNMPQQARDYHNAFGNLTNGPGSNFVKYDSWILSMDNPSGGDESQHLKDTYVDDPKVVDLLTFASKYVNGSVNDSAAHATTGAPVQYAAKLQKFMMAIVALAGNAIQCGGSGSTSSIVQTALNLAWPEPPGAATPPRDPLVPTTAYTTALNQYNAGVAKQGADCGVFVSTVMHASGADPNYPASGTIAQQQYVTDPSKNHGKYQIIQAGPNSTLSILQPGDILIINNGSAPQDGHTMIYVGNAGGKYNEASASFQDRMPNLDTISSLNDSLGRGYYLIARMIH